MIRCSIGLNYPDDLKAVVTLRSVETVSCTFMARPDTQSTTHWLWRRLHMQPCCLQMRHCVFKICTASDAGVSGRTFTCSTAPKNGLVQASSPPVTKLLYREYWLDAHPPLLQPRYMPKIAVSLPIKNAFILSSCSEVQLENAMRSESR